MQLAKAHVKNGRLVLDEPTDLPEGTEVTLSITDDDGGDYDDEERERINESPSPLLENHVYFGVVGDEVVVVSTGSPN